MRYERRVAGRCQTTVCACEHTTVLTHMCAQRVLGLAPNVAHVTAKRLLGMERVPVYLQPAVCQEQFAACGAAELLGHFVVGGTIVVEQVTKPGIGYIAEFARVCLRLEPPIVFSILCSLVLQCVELFNFTLGSNLKLIVIGYSHLFT